MVIFILLLVSLFACFKWGDWKNWKLYYPTLLFYICGSLLENIVTNHKNLWLFYGSHSTDIYIDLVFDFLIFPCLIILFLSNYPQEKRKQFLHVFIFLLVMSLVEVILFLNGDLTYYNGWNVLWSVFVYMGIFPLLRIHYRNPLLAWFILLVLIAGGMIYFQIPLNSL